MKTFTFRLLGLTSSLLVSAGLLRAAERLDPLTHTLGTQITANSPVEPPADGCSKLCNYLPRSESNARSLS